MLKKTMTFKDYNGNERTEDFYFNLTKAEVTEWELSLSGGIANKIEKIIAAQDQTEIINIFKELILMSYGEKSDDGRRFIKSDKLSKDFTHTEAYSDLFMELASDAEAAAAFVTGVIPDMSDIVDD